MLTRNVLTTSALFFLVILSHALPLIPQQPPTVPALRKRVAYSVVAVDGGSAATPPPANAPAVKTITQTSEQTETVTAPTSTLPASTETVVSTIVVNESEPAKTVKMLEDITKTPSPTSPPSYKVINADEEAPSPAVAFVTETSTALTSVDCTTSTSSESTKTSTSKTNTTSAVPSISLQYAEPATETAPPAEAGWVAPAGLLPPPSSTITTHSTLPTTTSRTYDDGRWHTTWRTWNTTSATLSSSSTTATIAMEAWGHWKK